MLGTKLEKLLVGAKREVVLVAPFIKIAALHRLLEHCSPHVLLTCVTRWRPDEIATGVSDLEVWPELKTRSQTSLWLRPNLHAKYYRADEKCLVGSANLTDTALGWAYAPNLELLVELPSSDPQLQGFEVDLLAGSVRVNDELYAQMKMAVTDVQQNPAPLFVSPTILPPTPVAEQALVYWLPQLRFPENLYQAYTGQWEKLTRASQEAAQADLMALNLPAGLAKATFNSYVAAVLLQYPVVQKIDAFITTPQRFGAVRDLLATLPCAYTPNFDASRAWQTLMRWLLHFLPNRYMLATPNYSEVFSKIGS